MNRYALRASSALGVAALAVALLVSVTPPASAVTAPGAPTLVSGTVGNASSLISWTPPTDDGGSPLHFYEIDWSPPSNTLSRMTVFATSQSATAMWLMNGTGYTFTVKAQNEAGLWGPASAPSSPITPQNICTISGTAGADVLTGTPGNDAICGLGGNDTIDGMGGNDTLIGGPGRNTVGYSTASQSVYVDLLPAFYRPTSGYASTGSFIDNLQGFNVVNGTAFDDNIAGTDNADTLVGGAGNDTINGWGGADTITGGPGNDSLIGFDGQDSLNGGSGNDLLEPGGQSDSVAGGLGTDTLSVSEAASAVTVDLTGGTSTGQDGSFDTLISVENVTGSRFDDTLTGDGLANVLIGGAGNDTLSGLAGNDILSGAAGSDSLDGGTGIDNCDGGTGTDTGRGCETKTTIP